MGGSNKPPNIVRLTAEEHFVIHELLVRIYPEVPYLVAALVKMAHRCNNNKLYGWIRRRHAANASALMTGNKFWLGKKHTEAWKAARRAEMLGMKLSPEACAKIGARHRGKKLSPEHIARIVAANRKPKSPEHRAKIAAAHIGIKVPPAARLKIGAANKGRIFTPETRARMSAAHKRRIRPPMSQATKDKLSAAYKRRYALKALASGSVSSPTASPISASSLEAHQSSVASPLPTMTQTVQSV